MERLTFDGNFCDIAMCSEVPGGSFCEDGYCSQRRVWERLKEYEDTGLEPGEIHTPAVGTYTNALIRYGEKNQTIVAIEELSECAKELCKVLIKGTLFIKQATIGAPCRICGQIIPGTYTGGVICSSCREAVLWAKRKMEAERIEKLNEKTRKEDEERWRKIMQGTV